MFVQLIIQKGATYKKSMVYKNEDQTLVDLTGFTAEMQIRTGFEIEPIILTLSTTNGRIILGGALGTIDLLIDKETTKLLAPAVKNIYDLELLSPSGEVIRLIEGIVTITDNVTQPGL